MTTIAIVASTGNPAFDRVLRGIYGTTVPGTRPGTVLFRPAAEFTRVSPALFSQIPQLPVRAADIKTREVDESEASLATAQMLFGLGARWANIYEANTGLRQDDPLNFGQVMLAGEAAQVASGVRAHLDSQGMQVFEVPVLIKGEVLSHGSYINTPGGMVSHMDASQRTIEVDPQRAPRPLGGTALSGEAGALIAARDAATNRAIETAVAEPVAQPVGQGGMRAWLRGVLGSMGHAQPQAAPEADQAPADGQTQDEQPGAQPVQRDAWGTFQGIDATVQGTVYVVANSVEQVPRALHHMLEAHKEDAGGMHLELGEVVAVRDLEREDLSLADFDEDDDSYGEAP